MDRCEQGLKVRFVKVEALTEDDIAEVVGKISRRVIRKLSAIHHSLPRVFAPTDVGVGVYLRQGA